MKYVTRLDRFVVGDFPMVCAHSGKPATKMVPVQAYRTSTWPWLFFPDFLFFVTKWVAESDHPWGKLPFADGEVKGVKAVYDKPIGVILNDVHPDFVAAVKKSQGRPTN